MATLGVAGVDLYYETRGSGTPILGIHGTPSSAMFWEDAAQRLAALGRCITYDRRGFARSGGDDPPPSLDLADHVADAVTLLGALDAAPAVVIGRSTGGQIAIALAERHPEAVRALVLLEPAVFALDESAAAWADELRGIVLAAEKDPGEAVMALFDRALGPELWAGLPEEVRAIFAAAGPAMLAEIHGDGLDLSRTPYAPDATSLARVRQPTLIVTAEDSYPAARAVDERLAAWLPEVQHVVLPGGHLIDPAHPMVLEFIAATTR